MAIIITVIILGIILMLLANMPTIVISTAGITSSSFFTYIRAAIYFIPIQTVARILALVFALWTVKVLIGLGITLKELFT